MIGRKFIFLILFFWVLHMPLMSQNHPKDYFRAPLDIPFFYRALLANSEAIIFTQVLTLKLREPQDIKSEQLLMDMFLE